MATVTIAVASSACGSSAPTAAPARCSEPSSGCTLRELGARRHVLIGAAVTSTQIATDGTDRQLLLSQFDSVTPEYQATWTQLEPHEGQVDYGPLDSFVDFAQSHGLSVRGHALVWDQPHDLPTWVTSIDDPAKLRQVVDQHIRAVVGRYRGRVARWDVVNEPLETSGGQLHRGHLLSVLGPSYIADAFRSAHAADPSASLWLNESNTEVVARKATALVDLAGALVASGVPINGVGLETHLLSGHAPKPGVIEGLIRRLRGLGLQVAITELDVPRPSSGATSAQVAAYRQVVNECLAAGCSEITTWGIDNGHTWLDAHLHRAATDPLLFTASGATTPAFDAVRAALDPTSG